MEDGLEWAQGGLKWYPDDPKLLLARGTINETTASLSWDAFSATQGSPAKTGREPPDWRVLWLKKARQDFDHALKADPGLVEARLRRGRVQWLLGEKAEAHASFDAVLASGGEDEVLFKARLFRGRCYEEEKELVRAEADYRAALALDPASQSAAVAASYVTWLQGKAGEPRELLEQALVQSGRRIRPDSYWDYSFGRVDRADALLEALREGVRR
jgi:tetratricopeptide (TPR) repeat protein